MSSARSTRLALLAFCLFGCDDGGGRSGGDGQPMADTAAADSAPLADSDSDSTPPGDAAGSDGAPVDGGAILDAPTVQVVVTIVEPAEGAGIAGLATFAARVQGADAEAVAFDIREVGEAGCRATLDAEGLFRCTFDVSALASQDYTLLATAEVGDERYESEAIQVTVLGDAPDGSRLVAGSLDPPMGRMPGDYTVGTTSGVDEEVGLLGGFVVPVAQDGVSLVVGLAEGAPEGATNALLAVWVAVPGEPPSAEPPVVALTPESTAAALVFMHPYFITDDPMVARRVLELAPRLEQVEALAEAIEATYGGTDNPLADDAFSALVAAAVSRMIDLMPGDSLPGVGGARTGNARGLHFHRLDSVRQTTATRRGDALEVVAELGMPLGSLMVMGEVDLDAEHQVAPDRLTRLRSIAHVRSIRNRLDLPFYPTFTLLPESLEGGVVPARSFFTYLQVIRRVIDLVAEELGRNPRTNLLPLDTSRPALYLVRMYSGRLTSGLEAGELAFAWEHDRAHMVGALVLNVAAGVIDVVSVMVNLTETGAPCLQGMVQQVSDAFAGDGISANHAGGLIWDTLEVATRSLTNCVAAELKLLADEGVAAVLTALGDISAGLADKLNLLNTVARVGRGADRLFTLAGLPGVMGTGLMVTPVDTLLLMVGDPFSPEVTAITYAGRRIELADLEPDEFFPVDAGDEIVLHGARFAADRDDGTVGVIFGDETGLRRIDRARVISKEALRATVPIGLGGALELRVLHPGDGFDLGRVLVVRPEVDEVRRAVVYQRDDLALHGRGLLPRYDLVLGNPEAVRLRAEPEGSTDERTRYRVREAEPGHYRLWLDTGFPALGADGLSELGLDLFVVGAPFVDERQRGVDGGAVFVLSGYNFGVEPDRLELQLVGADDAEGRAVATLGGPIPIYSVGTREGLSDAERVQPSFLRAALGRGAPDHAAQLHFRLTSPAGSVDFSLAAAGGPPPDLSRTYEIASAGDLQAAADFLSQRVPLDLSRHFEYRNVAQPPAEDWRCVDTWDGPDWLLDWPIGIAATAECPFVCLDPDRDPADCPTSWEQVAPERIRDQIGWQAPDQRLPPVTFTNARFVDLRVTAASGGGVVIEGPPGARSEVDINLRVTAPDVNGPVLRLSQVDGVRVTLQIEDGSSCDTAVLVENSSNVHLNVEAYGCERGVVVRGSTNIQVDVRAVRHRDVGVWIDGGEDITVHATGIHGSSGGPSFGQPTWSLPAARGRQTTGVRVEGGARRVVVAAYAITSHAVGVLVGEASQVRIVGDFGMPLYADRAEQVDPRWGNAIGVDLNGPARDVRIGGDVQGFRVDMPSAFVHADTAIRAGRVDGLLISDSFFGARPTYDADLTNDLGLHVTAAASQVIVRHNHFSSSGDESVLVEGSGGTRLTNNLFAGIGTGAWRGPRVIVPSGETDYCSRWRTRRPYSDRQGWRDARHRRGVTVRLAEAVDLDRNTYIGGEQCLLVEDSHDVRIVGDRAIHCDTGIVLRNVGDAELHRTRLLANRGTGLLLDGSANLALGEICARSNGGWGVEVTGSPRDWAGGVRVWEPSVRVTAETPERVIEPDAVGWRPLVGKAPAPNAKQISSAALLVDNEAGGLFVHEGDVSFELEGAVISGNGGPGVHVSAYQGSFTLRGSEIGVGWVGVEVPDGPHLGAQPNAGPGVNVEGTQGPVQIGGVWKGNVIAANEGPGVRIAGTSGSVVLQDNFIGVNPEGTEAMPNLGPGVHVLLAPEALVGGHGPGNANLISGNVGAGVLIEDGTPGSERGVRVVGNYIGVDASAEAALPNQGDGVEVNGCQDRVSMLIAGNLISGNEGAGVSGSACDSLRIVSNGLGQNHTGSTDANLFGVSLPNSGGGIEVVASERGTIGDNVVISGAPDGIRIEGGGRHAIVGNEVVGARGVAVRITDRSMSNRIVFNTLVESQIGVRVESGSTRNRIQGNVVTRNGRGIELLSGGNNHIPAPFVAAGIFRAPSDTWVVHGRVGRTVPDGSTVEVFADEGDQGRVPLATSVVVGRRFLARFRTPPPAALEPAASLDALRFNATVTDRDGNTSPFGLFEVALPVGCLPAGQPPALPLPGFDLRAVLVSEEGAALVDLASGERVAIEQAEIEGRVAMCGGLIAWAAGEPGARDLFTLDLESGQTTQLTDVGDDVEPDFSRDCSRLAFASDRSGSWDIWALDLAGGEPRSLTDTAAEDRWPSWAPDGERLALVRREGDEAAIVVRQADGTVHVLIDDPGDEGAPAWHPTEERVAFERCTADPVRCGIWIHEGDRDVQRPVGAEGCHDRAPVWAIVAGLDEAAADAKSHLLFTRLDPEGAPRQAIVATDLGYVLWSIDEGASVGGCCG